MGIDPAEHSRSQAVNIPTYFFISEKEGLCALSNGYHFLLMGGKALRGW